MFFKNARILNSEGQRIAWGTIKGMERDLDRMVKYMENIIKRPDNYSDKSIKIDEGSFML